MPDFFYILHTLSWTITIVYCILRLVSVLWPFVAYEIDRLDGLTVTVLSQPGGQVHLVTLASQDHRDSME